MQKVKIRYIGKSLLIGRPKREFIVIGGQKFWNCRRFPEQLPDLSYLRPIEFYERNKTILDNKHLFILEFVEDATSLHVVIDEPKEKKAPEAPEVPKSVSLLLTPELIKLGVTEINGRLWCPHCIYNITKPKKMLNHILNIHS
jgi:hypothetical protein